MGKAKIVFGDRVLIDLTKDTVTKSVLLKGNTAHDADGEPIVGDCTYDMDTSEANAKASEILKDREAGVGGVMVKGTMPNNGSVGGAISSLDEVFHIPYGFHDGGGTVGISEAEKAKGIPENIREGVTFMGIPGAMKTGEGVIPQSKEVVPSTQEQLILPDPGFTHITQVLVKGIPYTEVENETGGITVIIG